MLAFFLNELETWLIYLILLMSKSMIAISSFITCCAELIKNINLVKQNARKNIVNMCGLIGNKFKRIDF